MKARKEKGFGREEAGLRGVEDSCKLEHRVSQLPSLGNRASLLPEFSPHGAGWARAGASTGGEESRRTIDDQRRCGSDEVNIAGKGNGWRGETRRLSNVTMNGRE